MLYRDLTVNLRGRPEAPIKRRGRTLSPGARGANPQAHHGPLHRLLDFECLLRINDFHLVINPTFSTLKPARCSESIMARITS